MQKDTALCYLNNATTVQFQPRQQKCSLLHTKLDIIISQIHNIIREVIQMCKQGGMKCFLWGLICGG